MKSARAKHSGRRLAATLGLVAAALLAAAPAPAQNVWPVSGRVTGVYDEWRGDHWHHAIDIAGPTGDTIGAAYPGTRSFAGWSGGYGNLAVVDHASSYQTYYAHNSGFASLSDPVVRQNQTIAYRGSTGNSSGPHCHFEVRRYGTKLRVSATMSAYLLKGQPVPDAYGLGPVNFTGAIVGRRGKVLDAQWGGTANGTPLWVWEANGGGAQQFTSAFYPGYLRNVPAGRVADVAGGGTANGTELVLWDYHGGGNQRWWFTNAVILGFGGDKTVDTPNANNGTKVHLWSEHGGANQKWNWHTDGTIRGFGGKCLDVEGWSTANGTRVQVWDCHGGANQQWGLGYNGEIVGYGGKCLDAATGDPVNGTPLVIHDCHGGQNQKWRVRGEIRGIGSNRCLDDPRDGLDNGRRVYIFDCHGGPNQQWEFYIN